MAQMQHIFYAYINRPYCAMNDSADQTLMKIYQFYLSRKVIKWIRAPCGNKNDSVVISKLRWNLSLTQQVVFIGRIYTDCSPSFIQECSCWWQKKPWGFFISASTLMRSVLSTFPLFRCSMNTIWNFRCFQICFGDYNVGWSGKGKSISWQNDAGFKW